MSCTAICSSSRFTAVGWCGRFLLSGPRILERTWKHSGSFRGQRLKRNRWTSKAERMCLSTVVRMNIHVWKICISECQKLGPEKGSWTLRRYKPVCITFKEQLWRGTYLEWWRGERGQEFLDWEISLELKRNLPPHWVTSSCFSAVPLIQR